ncbi:MAG: methionyl-tRNA formyltransferase [Clostridiales bacterium]|nr:methionyl-tRNA formyltransferase [Clostridiales bacterium]
MNIIFMGTPDFAVTCLERLIDEKYSVCAVFTQPDKKTGRKQIVTPPPVKLAAEKNGIPVFQPNSLKTNEAADIIKRFCPDLIVVAAYGKILPEEILNLPEYGCINVHASLLPKYRGAAPIQRAVLNGEKETGVCIMQMDKGLDTGDVIYSEKTEIGINETSDDLFKRLSFIGAKSLVKAISLIESGRAVHIKQTGEPTYAAMIDKSICVIDWNKSAFEIHNKIRALQSKPAALTYIKNKEIKIHKSVLSNREGCEPGAVISNRGVLTVSCGDGKCIDILEVQPVGKKKMDIKSFLSGNKIPIDYKLGKAE